VKYIFGTTGIPDWVGELGKVWLVELPAPDGRRPTSPLEFITEVGSPPGCVDAEVGVLSSVI